MGVLLVEDNDAVRGCVADALGDAGIAVTEHSSAEDCLALTEAEAPEVLITDIDLGPGMDGLSLAAAAKRRWPVMPVVFISGGSPGPGMLDRCDRFIAKPFHIVALLEAIAEACACARDELANQSG